MSKKAPVPSTPIIQNIMYRLDSKTIQDMVDGNRASQIEPYFRSHFKAAVIKGDTTACAFLRASLPIKFTSSHYTTALRNRDDKMENYLWQNASEAERTVFATSKNVILAMRYGLHMVGVKLARECNHTSGKRYKNNTLTDWAVMTGDLNNIDFALNLYPKEAVPELFLTAIKASRPNRQYSDEFPQIRNPIKVIDHLLTQGLNANPILEDILKMIINPDVRGPANKAAEYLLSIILTAEDFDKAKFIEEAKKHNYGSKQVKMGIAVFLQMLRYEDYVLDLDSIRQKINAEFKLHPLQDVLTQFLQHIEADFAQDTDDIELNIGFDGHQKRVLGRF